MSPPLTLRPEAQGDLLAIHDGFERQSVGLGTAYGDAVDELLVRMQGMSALYAVAHNDARRAKVRNLLYVAYNRVLADRIEVFAVLHGSRDRQIWLSRT
jgi:toxin ParE1/3/4